MFHIFQKAYIDIDSFINLNLDRIVISKTNGYPMHQELDKMFIGTLFAYGNQISDVIGPDKMFPTFGDMMDFLHDYSERTGKKVVVYCDQEAHIQIMSLWLKSMFLNPTADSAYRVVRAYYTKQILLGGRSVRGLEDQYHTYLYSLLDFTNVFNNTSVDQIVVNKVIPKMIGKRSQEYLFGSYLYNGSFKEELKSTIYNLILRYVEEFFKETYRDFQLNSLKNEWQTRFNLRTYTIDNLLEIVDDPVLQTLQSTNSWRTMGGVASDKTRVNLDITSWSEAQMNLVRNQVSFMDHQTDGVSHPSHIRTLKLIETARAGYLSDEMLEWVIDAEDHPMHDTRWWSIKDNENINVYMMQYFFEEHRQGRSAGLSPYLLRG